MHYSFMWFIPGVCVAVSPTGMAPMRMPSGPAQVLTCVPMATAGISSMAHVPTALMLGAHALATVATAWVMARGERVLWLMVSAFWTVFQPVGPVLISPQRRRAEPPLTAGVGCALVALGGIGRRGPPARGFL